MRLHCIYIIIYSYLFHVAYEVLGDPEKRARYDQFGFDTEDKSSGGGGGGGFNNFNFNFDDFFSGFDNAEKAHQQGHHEHQKTFSFQFGGGGDGGFFNFDDLFEDDDDNDDDNNDGFFTDFGNAFDFGFGNEMFGDMDHEEGMYNDQHHHHHIHNNIHRAHHQQQQDIHRKQQDIHRRNMEAHQQNLHRHAQHQQHARAAG